MASVKLLDAPADRPAGERGWRAPVAYAIAVAAVPTLALSYGIGAREGAAYLAVAAALLTAAVLIWTARRPHALVLAGVAVAASVMAVVLLGVPNLHRVQGTTRGAETEYSFDADAPPITPAQAKAVPMGSTEEEVEEALGSAAGSGTLRRPDGTDSPCLIYGDQAGRQSFDPVFAFCFAEDRYTSLHRW
jgi:hypothetical protein